MRALVIYHAECTDGACAAWAASRHLLIAGYFVDLIPARPMQMPDGVLKDGHLVVPWQAIYVVDTALPLGQLETLNTLAPEGCWVFDHHKTNEEELKAYPNAVFDMNRSGAGLAWDEVSRMLWGRSSLRPALVNYVEDRDLWRFQLPRSKEVSAGIRHMLGTDPEAFAQAWSFGGTSIDEFARIGRTVLEVEEKQAAVAVEKAYLTFALGEDVAIVASPLLQSEIGHQLVTAHRRVGIVWYTRPLNGTLMAQLSFRSDDDLPDVSKMAKRLGGGGHRNAAGATIPLTDWVRHLT